MYFPFYNVYQPYSGDIRQNLVSGQATWTYGGSVTQCNIPWSSNQYMTVAVSSNSPYQCGQKLKVINPKTTKEIIVTIVDTVPNAAVTSLNLHRQAFEALGADPAVGILSIQFQPTTEQDAMEWDDYLLNIIQVGYPDYNVINYKLIEKTEQASNQVKEVYDFALQHSQGWLHVRGTVVYQRSTNNVISFEVKQI